MKKNESWKGFCKCAALGLGLALLAVSTGCGKKEVNYNIGASSVSENTKEDEGVTEGANATNSQSAAAKSLKKKLGISKDGWDEKIQGKVIQRVAVDVHVPDTEDFYVEEVKEHYYNEADKKALCQLLFDKESIGVDLERVWCKETIDKKIQKLKEHMDDMEEEAKDTNSSYQREVAKAKSGIQKQISYLRKQQNQAMSKKEIEKVKDIYTLDAFLGERDGVTYTIQFEMDEDRKTSRIIYSPVDVSQVTDLIEQTSKGRYTPIGSEYYDENGKAKKVKNKCNISQKEAKKKAIDFCDQMGIGAMKVVKSDNLSFADNSPEGDVNFGTAQGYIFQLTRNIGEADVDTLFYGENYGENNETVLPLTSQEEKEKNSYMPERIELAINDYGVIGMRYVGCMTLVKQTGPVKLLGFDKIKLGLEESIKKDTYFVDSKGTTWSGCSLVQLRVPSKDKKNQYSMIPVWRLSVENLNAIGDTGMKVIDLYINFKRDAFSLYNYHEVKLINAMDGSEIDVDESGLRQYETIMDTYGEDLVEVDYSNAVG